MLSFHEKYVLLTINDKKGTIAAGYSKTYGFIGALFMELFEKKFIKIEDKKIICTENNPDSEILNEVIDLLKKRKKPMKVQVAIQHLGYKLSKSFEKVIDNLIEKGILKKEKKKIIWIFNVNHYPTNNPEPENMIKSRIKGIVLYGNNSDAESLKLLSLINALDLYREIFSKDEIKKAKKRVKEIVLNEEVGNDIGKIIQDEIMAAVAVSIATSAIVTTN